MEIREGHNKFYINDEQGKQIAEIVFVPTGENLAIIEHTDVDESLKGQGIGKQPVSYTHLTLPTTIGWCRSRWSPYH